MRRYERTLRRARDRLKVLQKMRGFLAEVAEEDDLPAALHQQEIIKHLKNRARGLMDGACPIRERDMHSSKYVAEDPRERERNATRF